MTQPLFRGAATALVTPLRDGKVDVDALRRLVEQQLENGVAALVSCGTTGEPSTLSLEERELVIRETVKAVNGRVPVICGTGANCHPATEGLGLPSSPEKFLTYFDDPARPQTRLDRDLYGGMGISIGRLREDPVLDYKFVCLSHNTLRGAAGGAVLLAELLCAKGYIQPYVK